MSRNEEDHPYPQNDCQGSCVIGFEMETTVSSILLEKFGGAGKAIVLFRTESHPKIIHGHMNFKLNEAFPHEAKFLRTFREIVEQNFFKRLSDGFRTQGGLQIGPHKWERILFCERDLYDEFRSYPATRGWAGVMSCIGDEDVVAQEMTEAMPAKRLLNYGKAGGLRETVGLASVFS